MLLRHMKKLKQKENCKIFNNAMRTAHNELEKSAFIQEEISIAALHDLQVYNSNSPNKKVVGDESLVDTMCRFILNELDRLASLPFSHVLFCQVLELAKKNKNGKWY